MQHATHAEGLAISRAAHASQLTNSLQQLEREPPAASAVPADLTLYPVALAVCSSLSAALSDRNLELVSSLKPFDKLGDGLVEGADLIRLLRGCVPPQLPLSLPSLPPYLPSYFPSTSPSSPPCLPYIYSISPLYLPSCGLAPPPEWLFTLPPALRALDGRVRYLALNGCLEALGLRAQPSQLVGAGDEAQPGAAPGRQDDSSAMRSLLQGAGQMEARTHPQRHGRRAPEEDLRAHKSTISLRGDLLP